MRREVLSFLRKCSQLLDYEAYLVVFKAFVGRKRFEGKAHARLERTPSESKTTYNDLKSTASTQVLGAVLHGEPPPLSYVRAELQVALTQVVRTGPSSDRSWRTGRRPSQPRAFSRALGRRGLGSSRSRRCARAPRSVIPSNAAERRDPFAPPPSVRDAAPCGIGESRSAAPHPKARRARAGR